MSEPINLKQQFWVSLNVLLSVLIGCVVLIIWRDAWLSLDRALLAAAVILVGSIPCVIYLATDRAQRPPFPLMALCGLFYAVFFGLPAFLTSQLIHGPDRERFFYESTAIGAINIDSQLLIIVGIASMFGAWVVSQRFFFQKLPGLKFYGVHGLDLAIGTAPARSTHRAILALAALLALGNLAYWMLPFLRSLPSIGQFLQPAGYIAFALFYLTNTNEGLAKIVGIFYFAIILPLWAGSLLVTGFLTSTALLVCLWLALRIHIKGFIPWKSMFAALLIFVWIYPHAPDYRANYWRVGKDKPAIEKLMSFGRVLVERTWLNGLGANKNTSPTPFRGLVQRLALNLQFSRVVELSPEKVPFWQGETYHSLFLGWVPRVFWGDKPKEIWGNEFGRRYHLLPPENKSMSMNLPWLVELYANFGTKGVVFGMALIGLFLSFLERLLNRPDSDIVTKGVGAAVLLPLFYHESNFTVMTGSLLPLIVCLWIYFNVPIYVMQMCWKK